jgi:prepilin-type N-terminal cleavage/methylation domain-containing protein
MKTKVRAFTIIELIMAMLISSVIISMVYYVYILFNHQFSNYREKVNAIDEYLILQKALRTDMESADAISAPSASEITCSIIREKEMVVYTFSNGYIARSCGDARDTFHIKNSGYEATYFKETGLVETLVLKVSVSDGPFRNTCQKLYSACQLMKQQPAYE